MALIWGGTFIGSRTLAPEVSLMAAATLRFAIAMRNTCFFAALARMPAGRAALFTVLNPIMTTLFLATLLRERIGAMKWTGIGLAFAGAAVVITRGDLRSSAE